MGNCLHIKRDENGYRQYTTENLETLTRIKDYLYEQNYSIKQVREILNLEESKQDIAATLVGETDEQISSLVSILIDKVDSVEEGIEDLKKGQSNLKSEYLQAIKLLNITIERRDRELLKEVRKRLNDKEEKSKNLLQRVLPALLPWHKNN